MATDLANRAQSRRHEERGADEGEEGRGEIVWQR